MLVGSFFNKKKPATASQQKKLESDISHWHLFD